MTNYAYLIHIYYKDARVTIETNDVRIACEELLHQRRVLIGTDTTDNLGLWVHDIGGIAVIAAFLVLGTID